MRQLKQMWVVDKKQDIYYIKQKSRLSIYPSAFFTCRNSPVSSSIETALARNESGVIEVHRVYFYRPIVPPRSSTGVPIRQDVCSHYPERQLAGGLSPTVDGFLS